MLAASIGAVVGLVLWISGLTSAGTDLLTAAVLAGIAGLAVGFVVASVVARLRADGSVVETGHVEPRRYDILVEEELAPTARDVLGAHA